MITPLYILSESLVPEDILQKVNEKYKSIEEKSAVTEQIYYDTFDWRLYNKELVLAGNLNVLCLKHLKTEDVLESIELTTKTTPRFWWEFPESTLKNNFKKYLDVRALIPLINIHKNSVCLRILNSDSKTVVRLYIDEFTILTSQKESKVIRIVKLNPVRGYNEELDDINQFLKRLNLLSDSRSEFELILNLVNIHPGSYSSKINVDLKPDMPANVATKEILKFLLRIMKENIPGIKDDIDSEFLHDFRVAIRRTRSALSQIKEVFPKDVTDRFKNDFSYLGKLSNRLRDLDVYLLKRKTYYGLIPGYLHQGLNDLFVDLTNERKSELKKFIKALTSEKFNSIINAWEIFLNIEEQQDSNNSDKPVIELAKKFIYKKYNQIIKTGKKIEDNTPDPVLHKLRIECKKLRYLLEFFYSLFPQQDMMILVKQLKRLQDNLGDFNDLSVQQEYLEQYLDKITSETKDSIQFSAALGGLISVLNTQQQKTRDDFEQKFNEFNQQENKNLYQKLFSESRK